MNILPFSFIILAISCFIFLRITNLPQEIKIKLSFFASDTSGSLSYSEKSSGFINVDYAPGHHIIFVIDVSSDNTAFRLNISLTFTVELIERVSNFVY